VKSKIGPYKDFHGGDLDPQWCTLGEIYLQYIRSYDSANGMIQLDNFSKFFSYPPTFFERLYRLFTVVFVRSSGSWTVPFIKRLIQQVIAIAHNTHLQLVRQGAYDTTYPFETPAKLLQRLLNSIMSDRSGTKKIIAYFVGNQLFRSYFKVLIQWR
jgi:hypothetical protein